MKNRGNIRVPAAHSSIMSSKQPPASVRISPACVYLCTPPYICICPRVCTRVCIFMHAKVCVFVCELCCDFYLNVFVIFFHQDTPFPIPRQPMGMRPVVFPGPLHSSFFYFFFSLSAEVRNRTLASMWFELRAPETVKDASNDVRHLHRANSILLNGGREKELRNPPRFFWPGFGPAIKTGRKPITQ